ncbi:S1 family peptidase [Paraclostridium sordellii]|uniref:V8-like Glu-specific endopeptidase n=1 Tax=Paraclostridium sordellii TaxID=1505 RepID=A0A9P1L130_PARSO|nr:serine protease [Paeniclostridium sordellii]CEO33248.1 V8-like Glu-specific endopeptidase [[Clostridium] sordellii] [Paeniclostridium sordellii]
MMTNIDKERIEKCVVQIECVNKLNDEDKSIGSGFFVDKNIVVTASHVINKYYETPSQYYINIIPINAGLDKDIKVSRVINEMDYNNYISILELEEVVEDINPIKFTLGYEIQRGDDYFSFGHPAGKRDVGLPVESKISTTINEHQSRKADWDLNISTERLKNFTGFSGSPVIINNMLVGIIQIESTANGEAMSIGMSSIGKMKDFIPLEYCKDYSDVFFIKKLMQRDGHKIHTINDMETRLKEITNPSITLDFFEIDDEEFKEKFKGCLTNNMYIVGRSREETLYCILNELKYSIEEEKVIVVEDEKSWENLKDIVKGYILIPNFYVGEIVAIRNNINIFIYGDDEHCTIPNKIQLRRRTRRTIIKKLEGLGIDSKTAYEYAEKTNGLFIPLKRKLFNGKYNILPTWHNNKENISFVTALLCGKWTESQGDKAIIEKISGKSYDEFIFDLQPFTRGSEPFLVEVVGYGERRYQLANIELAWELLDYRIDKIIWNRFKELSYEVITEISPIFYKPLEDYYIENIKSDKSKYSDYLKQGMIRSLIFRSIYRGNEHQFEIDSIVKDILSKINSKEGWAYFSQFFTELCEASPKSVIDRLENEYKNKTGLIELFGISSNGVFAKNYYTHIIWAVEQLLLYDEYAPKAIKWLFYMDNINLEYKISNSPRNTLRDIFCAWYNVSVLSSKTKIILAEQFIKQYENSWDLFFNELPNKHQVIDSTMSRPKYREFNEINQPTSKEVYDVYISYANLCIEYTNNNISRWINLINEFNIFPNDILYKILEKLTNNISIMNDFEKRIIKDKIREELYRHRYFSDSGWSMDESRLQNLEKLLISIEFEDEVYEYIYLFQDIYNLPILNPIPYSKENSNRNENEILKKEEVKKAFINIKNYNLDLIKLIQLIDKKNYSILGAYIAEYYTDRIFDIMIYNKFLSIEGIDDVILGYIRWIYQNSDKSIIKKIKSTLRGYNENYDLYVRVLSMEKLVYSKHPEIMNENENIKNLYWRKPISRFNISKDRDTLNWVLGELKKYNNILSYIECIYDGLDIFDSEEVLKYMIKLDEFKNIVPFNHMTSYYINEIIDRIEEDFKYSVDKYYEIAKLELSLNGIIEWNKMKCTQYIFKTNPIEYAEIINMVFLHEGERKDDIEEDQKKRSESIFNLYYDAVFCPCEEDGNVDLDKLKKWVEKFKEKLEDQKQLNLLGHELGRLFAYSPMGKDGYYPHEAIRSIIEELEDESLRHSYIVAECNKRGVYSPDAGRTEKEIALKYKENAENIRWLYPETAKIYDDLYERYYHQSELERERAEHEW